LDVAGIEPLGLALGFGRRATYSHLARLADVGLVVRAYDPGGSVVAITAAGRRAIGEPRSQVRIGATHGLGLQHANAVSWAAALLTLRDRTWAGAREMRRDPSWLIPFDWSIGHRPDLGVFVGGTRVAIEVELWRRPPSRLRSALSGYDGAIASGQIGGVISISDRADVLDALTRAAGRVGLPDRCFRTRRLADVRAAARSLPRESTTSLPQHSSERDIYGNRSEGAAST
jgi:hypothetical protein